MKKNILVFVLLVLSLYCFAQTEAGDVWFVIDEPFVQIGDQITAEVHVNTESQKLSAYGVFIKFDPALITFDSVHSGVNGFMTAYNLDAADKLKVTGLDLNGKEPGLDLHLLTINWIASSMGLVNLDIEIDELADETNMAIGNPNGMGRNVGIDIKRYAILLNGSSEAVYWDSIEFMYTTLTDYYRFDDDDIFLLNYDDIDNRVDSLASMESLQTVFTNLKSIINPGDEIFFFQAGHGSGYGTHGILPYGLAGNASVDDGDYPDVPEQDFKLYILSTGGDYRCLHGLNELKCFKAENTGAYYRHKIVSHFNGIEFENQPGVFQDDNDELLEDLISYLKADTNKNGIIDEDEEIVFQTYLDDGHPPYDPVTDTYDENDWSDNYYEYIDNYNSINNRMPNNNENAYLIFDRGLDDNIEIDIDYDPQKPEPEVHGIDIDNDGVLDSIDVNMDGDLNDWVSFDEYINLPGDYLYDDDLEAFFEDFPDNKITAFIGSCFSGGFIDDLSGPKRVTITATCKDTRGSGATTDWFTSALKGSSICGRMVYADYDLNGHVSMQEAFNFATSELNVDSSWIPHYDDDGDMVGHTFPVPQDGDGDLGSKTYLANPDIFSLFVNIQGTGTVTAPGEGVFVFYSNTEVVLNAIPAPGYVFGFWTGDVAQRESASTKVTMDSTKTVTACFYPEAEADIIYVDENASGGNGSSWDYAYTTLQDALEAASSGDEIWVARGTYKPHWMYDPGDEDSLTFQMKNEVSIYGGFSGNETTRETRDWEENPTVLCGTDIGIYHVFYHPPELDLNQSAVLDGFIIRDGGVPNNRKEGAGMYNNGCSPSISNCIFERNTSTSGGGIYNYACQPIISNCIFDDNYGSSSGSIYNNMCSLLIKNCMFSNNRSSFYGTIYNNNSYIKLVDCTFKENELQFRQGGALSSYSSNCLLYGCEFLNNFTDTTESRGGGAIYSTIGASSAIHLFDCVFSGNSSTSSKGGAVYNDDTLSRFVNCIFINNKADNDAGGAIYSNNPRSVITNCTFYNNTALYGKGLAFTNEYDFNNFIINNSIFRDGDDEIYNGDNSDITVSYSNIYGGYTGTGNIDEDPDFINPDDNDFRLICSSVCIDAGDNSVVLENINDFTGYARVFDGDNNGTATVDMGAYEYLYTSGDANMDCAVDIIDALLIAQYYVGLIDSINVFASDVNCDQSIDIIDALLIAQYYVGLITEFPCQM